MCQNTMNASDTSYNKSTPTYFPYKPIPYHYSFYLSTDNNIIPYFPDPNSSIHQKGIALENKKKEDFEYYLYI